jgi:hypothetical protein
VHSPKKPFRSPGTHNFGKLFALAIIDSPLDNIIYLTLIFRGNFD